MSFQNNRSINKFRGLDVRAFNATKKWLSFLLFSHAYSVGNTDVKSSSLRISEDSSISILSVRAENATPFLCFAF